MSRPMIVLESQKDQTPGNLRRWADLQADANLAEFEGRIETDRHGRILMSPPPAPLHGSYQLEIGHLLRLLMPKGRVLTECPISTADGVKATDVAWASPSTMRHLGNRICFPRSPELCVEVLSPCNTEAEMSEKCALYFDAGAAEVWLCAPDGSMRFLRSPDGGTPATSVLCPKFPAKVVLR